MNTNKKKQAPPPAPPPPGGPLRAPVSGLKKIQFPQSQKKAVRKEPVPNAGNNVLTKLEEFAVTFKNTEVGSAWDKKIQYFKTSKGKMEFNILLTTKSPQLYDYVKYHTSSISDLSYYNYKGAISNPESIMIPLSDEAEALNKLLTHVHETVGIRKLPPLVTALYITLKMQENAKKSRKELKETLSGFLEEIRGEVVGTVTRLLGYYQQVRVLFENPSTSTFNAAKEANTLIRQSTKGKVLDVPSVRHKLYTTFQSGLQTYCRSMKEQDRPQRDVTACSILDQTTPLFARMKTLAEMYVSAAEFESKFNAIEKSLQEAYSYMKPSVKGLFRNTDGRMSLEAKRATFVKILEMYEIEIGDVVRALPQHVTKQAVAHVGTVKSRDITNASPKPMPSVTKVSQAEGQIVDLQRQIEQLKKDLKSNEDKAMRLEAQVARMTSNVVAKNQNIDSKMRQIHTLEKENIKLVKQLRTKHHRVRLLRLSLISIAIPSSLLTVLAVGKTFRSRPSSAASTALVPYPGNGSMQIGNASFNLRKALNATRRRNRSVLPISKDPIYLGPGRLVPSTPLLLAPGRQNSSSKMNDKIMYTSSVAASALLALSLAKMAKRSKGRQVKIKSEPTTTGRSNNNRESSPPARITRLRKKKTRNCIGCR